ncbi:MULTISPECIES: hypothetical protein [Bradyrhizobium]|uniref:hypothetical protein n=1 Tax=Bradyrhizobium elkanii TaxID=29448 RepID=UPI0004187A2B|nr:hypothetical protein [Bradyrhizobium elkanii]
MDQRRRPPRLSIERHFRQTIKLTHEQLRQSLELLRQPRPDTFLGRKTQEPFPKQNDE